MIVPHAQRGNELINHDVVNQKKRDILSFSRASSLLQLTRLAY